MHPRSRSARSFALLRRGLGNPWTAAYTAVVAIGVGLRLYNPSVLWLDEALSVNISRLPLAELFDALRHDGSPPLYYLLLHYWMEVFGQGDIAVRALSTVFALAALPVSYFVGRRIHGPAAGRAAVVVLAVNPFLVRYSTEARMYALVVLLTLLAVLAVQRAAERPAVRSLLPVSLLSGLLALTHYWALFFLAAAGILLIWLSVRGRYRDSARRLLGAVLAGAVLFAPWIPGFAFQVRHTGTPWADPPGVGVLVDTGRHWAGGVSWPATGLALLLITATAAALWRPHRRARMGRWLRLRAVPDSPYILGLFVCAFGALLLAVVASRALSAGFAVRYTSAMVAPALVLAGVGVNRFRPPVRSLLLVGITCLGLAGSAGLPFADDRTQARATADVLAAAGPDDLVVYCPDQLGPAVSRLLPASLEQVLYPTLLPPQLVDWVDYAPRNAASSPRDIGASISAMTTGQIWLVTAPNYRTFGTRCAQLDRVLTNLRGGRQVAQSRDPAFAEQQAVVQYPSALQ